MHEMLIEKAHGCDIVFIGKGESVGEATLGRMKSMGLTIALWYGDMRPAPEPWLLKMLGHVDCYFMTSAGDVLNEYHALESHEAAHFFSILPIDCLSLEVV